MFSLAVVKLGLSDLGSKWVRLAPNGTNLGLEDHFSVPFGMSHRFFPFGANLTDFRPKSVNPKSNLHIFIGKMRFRTTHNFSELI